jgi:predicted metal-dependent phosphoesterase TrpH
MLLKGCLHCHTTCSDGELAPQEVVEAYQARGYDFIALTDHDYFPRQRCLEAYRGIRSDLIVFYGIELTVFEKGYLHFNRIEGEREVLHILNHLGEYDLPLAKIVERLAALAKQYPLDAVEITTRGFRNPEFEVDDIPYPKMASDDSHTRQGIGRAWIEMDAARSMDAILRAVKHNDFWNCYL